jgi:glycosyltransferase involved in cell wall biosynthesis
MFNYEYPPLGGGGGVVHQHIAEELARRHRVTVVTSGCKGLAAYENVGGVDIHRTNVIGRGSLATASLLSMLSYFPASLRTGRKLIDEIRPDLINSHFAVPTGPSAVMLARRSRIPHALCIHGGDIYDPSKRLSPHRIPGLRHAVGWVLRRADRVLAQSKNTSDNAKTIYGYQGEIAIIPHGLKEPELPAFSRKELGLSEDHTVLVTVGRLVARKANHQLVQLMAEPGNSKVTLVIIGDGPERVPLLNLAKELKVDQRVILTGNVSESRKYQLLQAADIFVSTTSHEGFGLMYIEAMFCRLPIVTYDNGGQTDFLVNGQSGFLVPLNNREMFGRRLAQLAGSPEERKAMGGFNLALSQQFTIGHCACRYEAIFREMMSSPRNNNGSDAMKIRWSSV